MLALAIISLAVLSGFAGSNFLTAVILGLSLGILTIANTHSHKLTHGGWLTIGFTSLYGLCGVFVILLSFYGGKELAQILGT